MLCSRRPACARGGFTLLELLASIAVVALLMGLMLPALGKVRGRAMQASTHSRMRQCGQILGVYASDWKGAFPAFLDPSKSSWTLSVRSEGVSIEIEKYFLSGMVWNVALADAYFDGKPTSEVFYSAEQVSRDGPGGVPFVLPCVLFADPAFWKLETRTGPAQYRATYHHQVAYPSEKAVLVSIGGLLAPEGEPPPAVNTPVPRVAADGSVRTIPMDEYAPGCGSGEGMYEQSIHAFDAFVALHTVGGVRGRDDPG
ncbi:MAG: hypothetical protein GIKADHBN_03314 [Phycisphaerales bacterium]|nr:hypothetical protein [Phycisphaerales bacterium]